VDSFVQKPEMRVSAAFSKTDLMHVSLLAVLQNLLENRNSSTQNFYQVGKKIWVGFTTLKHESLFDIARAKYNQRFLKKS